MNEDKQLSPGLKVGMFFGFVVVWLGIGFLLDKVMPPFHRGGWGMWPILAVGLVFLFISIERVRYLFFRSAHDTRGFVAEVQKQLMHGNVSGALAYCKSTEQPLGRIVGAGLATLHRPDEEVQEAVDETALYELPKIEIRTGYLAMIGNIATLLGLLGTILGLIKSFRGVSITNINDPAVMAKAQQYVHLVPACQGLTNPRDVARCIEQNKATILAQGISEAMNCTAFGLLVGICSLLSYSVLNGRTQHMLDDISDSTVYLMNLAAGNRRAMKMIS
jgi:biopolymer transport protein ExbB